MQNVAKKKTMSTPLPGAGILGVNFRLIVATLFLHCCFATQQPPCRRLREA